MKGRLYERTKYYVALVNWFRNSGIREIYFPHLSHLRYCFIPVLVRLLESLTASPLATTATFSTVHFLISEAEYFSLVAISISSAQVVIEISTDPIKFTYFSVFSLGSVSSTGTVVLPISIAALAVTFLSILLSLLDIRTS